MKLRVQLVNAQVVTKKVAPYNINGKSGLSRKADFLIEEEVVKISLSEDIYDGLEIGESYDLIAELFLSNTKGSIKIVGIAK